jgi:N-acetylmuramoyl-L-alanine amidase
MKENEVAEDIFVGSYDSSDGMEEVAEKLSLIESEDVLGDDGGGIGAVERETPHALSTLSIARRLGRKEFAPWLAQQKVTRELSRIVLHHTQTASTSWDGENSIRACWNWHVNGRGWRHIGYHFILGPDGSIWVCRPLNWTGAHAGPKGNPLSVGVSLWADLTKEKPTEAAKEALGIVWAGLTDQFGMTPKIYFHRDFMSTDCPGNIGKEEIGGILKKALSLLNRPEQKGNGRFVLGGKEIPRGCVIKEGVAWIPARSVTSIGFRIRWDEQRKLGVIYNDERIFHSIPSAPSPNGRPQCFAMQSFIPCYLDKDGAMFVAARPLAQALGLKVSWDSKTETVYLD